MPALAVDDLEVSSDGKTLYAFTHGRGAWKVSANPSSTGVTVTIKAGWNLIDLPTSGSPTTASGLASALQAAVGSPMQAEATFTRGRFTLYAPGYSRDIAGLGPTQGIFVLSPGQGTWAPTGSAYTTGQTVTLTPGWNLVAFPYPTSGVTASAIANGFGGTVVQEVATYVSGSGYQTWTRNSTTDLPVANTVGAWVAASSGGTWTP